MNEVQNFTLVSRDRFGSIDASLREELGLAAMGVFKIRFG